MSRFRDEQLAEDVVVDEELDDELKQNAILRPTGTCMKYFALVAGIVLVVSGIVLIILSTTVDTSTIALQSVTIFRSGAAPTSITIDSFPAPVIVVLNNINITLIYGFAQVFGGIGFFLLFFLYTAMMFEIAYGSNSYLWGFLMISTLLYDVVIAIRCGLQDLTVLIFDGTLHFSILGIFLLGDLLNQRFYRSKMEELGQGRFSWAFLLIAAVIFVVVWGMQITSLVFAVTGPGGASTIDIITPLVALVAYIILFVLVGLHYGGVSFLESTYSRDLGIVILVAITLLVVPWLDVILFFTTNFF